MHIERFDPAVDHERLLACYRMFAVAHPVDDPDGPVMPQRAFSGWWAQGFGSPQQAWLATGPGGQPAGCYLLELPDRDNLSTGFCFLVVPPDRRRVGTGTALLAHCAGQAATAARSMLISETRAASAGTAFALAVGAEQGLTDLRRELRADSGGELPARLAELRALAGRHAAGYSLLSWSGPVPEPDVGQVAAVFEAMADAPREASMEPMQWDAARIRAEEACFAAQGATIYTVAARHDQSGDLAALTQLCLDPGLPDWAFQMLTAVARPHRGHRLGLLVKVVMQQLLAEREPGVRRVMTLNSDSNTHMIAVNEQLGYQVTDTFLSWELPVARALACSSGRAAASRAASGAARRATAR
jgi:GNAT superfamily N-acetyltransferase